MFCRRFCKSFLWGAKSNANQTNKKTLCKFPHRVSFCKHIQNRYWAASTIRGIVARHSSVETTTVVLAYT